MSVQFEPGPRNADEISGWGSDGGTLTARSVIITTGVNYRRPPRTSRSLLPGPLAGTGGRCWRRARGAGSVNLAGGVVCAGGST